MTSVAHAINSLDVKNDRSGGAAVSDPVTNASEFGSKITWYDDNGAEISSPYSWSEVSTELDALITAEAANAYKQKRRDAYPEIGDQLDLQYHDLLDGTTTWKDAVAAVKAAHPKE